MKQPSMVRPATELDQDHQKRYQAEYDKVVKTKEALEAKKKRRATGAH